MNEPLHALTAVFVLGIGAQWLAARLKLPSILLLLIAGFCAGPVLGIVRPGWELDPDRLLGTLLMPVVSLSVAVIMFEGGLTLKLSELKPSGAVIRNLVTIGTLVTWAIAAVAARLILGLPWGLSALLGALLVVSGPTVVLPLLKQVRPVGPVGPILKWEGILIDPIGVLLAVLVFDAVLTGASATGIFAAWGVAIAKCVLAGVSLGAVSAFVMIQLLKRHLIPDKLQNAVMLMWVFGFFTLAELVYHEAGLFAVTVMGLILTNQKRVPVKHIVEFKEHLTTLLLAAMFILLAARVNMADMRALGFEGIAFVAVLILVARPAAVFASTWGSDLTRNEKLFLSALAPRGIVAAAMSAFLAIRLEAAGFEHADVLTSVTFLVIVGTVFVYGLSALPLARYLGLAPPDPQGVLIVGAQPVGRIIAEALQEAEVKVLVVDGNRGSVLQERLVGIEAVHGNVLDHDLPEHLDLGGIGYVLALTSNDEVNTIASLNFMDVFERSHVYQLAGVAQAKAGSGDGANPLRGRTLFGDRVTYPVLDGALQAGGELKCTRLSEAFDWQALQDFHQGDVMPLFVLNQGAVRVASADDQSPPRPGDTVLSLISPEAANSDRLRRVEKKADEAAEKAADRVAPGDG